ncbi:MAG: leucine-rich repeat domain-containing protein [Oligoflexales bacterium]
MPKNVLCTAVLFFSIIPNAYSLDFRNYCDQELRKSLSLSPQQDKSVSQTVIGVLQATQSMTCDQAWEALQTTDNLSLKYMGIEDISPLRGYKGLNLDLSNNKIHSLWGLEHLPQLQRLLLHENKIQDLSPLAQHKNLKTINISDNPLDIDGTYVLKDLFSLHTLYAENTPFAQNAEEVLSLAHHIFNNQVKLGNIQEENIMGQSHKAMEVISIADYITNTYRPVTVDDINQINNLILSAQSTEDIETHGQEQSSESSSNDDTALSFSDKFLYVILEIQMNEVIKELAEEEPQSPSRFILSLLSGADKWDFSHLRAELKSAPFSDQDIDVISKSIVNKKRLRSIMHAEKFYITLRHAWERRILDSTLPQVQKSIILDKIHERSQLTIRALEYKFASKSTPPLDGNAYMVLAQEIIKSCPNMITTERLLNLIDTALARFSNHNIPLSMRSGTQI